MNRMTKRECYRPFISAVVQANKHLTENEIKAAVRKEVKPRFYLDTRHAQQSYYAELKFQIQKRHLLDSCNPNTKQTELF